MTPFDDGLVEGDETVVLTLAPDAAYQVGTPDSATVTIADALAAPQVSLTAPADGSNFTVGDTITVSADASDPDGTVTNVQFFANGTLIGQDNTSPYSIAWSGASVGSYQLTAEATDNDGLTTVSDPVGIVVNSAPLPTVTIAPSDPDASEATQDRGVFQITRSGPTDAVMVHYTVSGSASNGDYTETLSGTASFATGQTTFSIVVTPFDDGLVEGDETVVLTLAPDAAYQVGTPDSATVTIADALAAPQVSLTAPADGSNFTVGDTITVSADASDPDGTVTNVQFFANGTLIGQDNTSPYSIAWSGASVGSYQLTAEATDNDGLTTVSDPVGIVVNSAPLPTVTIAPSDPDASEATQDRGVFQITRSGPTDAVMVHYTVSGSASNGDYTETLSGTASFATGQTTFSIVVTPFDDGLVEGDETVVLTLAPDAAYQVGTPDSATVTIADTLSGGPSFVTGVISTATRLWSTVTHGSVRAKRRAMV